MTADELVTRSLAQLGDGGLDDVELDRRVLRLQGALHRLRHESAEAARIDALVVDAESAEARQEAMVVGDGNTIYATDGGIVNVRGRSLHREPIPRGAAVDRRRRKAKRAEIKLSERTVETEGRLRLEELRLSAVNNRNGTYIFGGTLLLAVATIALLALRSVSVPATAAITALNGVVAAAGAFAQSKAAVRRSAITLPQPSSRPHGTGSGQRDVHRNADSGQISIETVHGDVHLQAAASSPLGRVSLRRRTVTIALVGLAVACAVAFAISIIAISAAGQMTPYAIWLLVPGATSILLLITSWWWRVGDGREPGPEERGTSGVHSARGSEWMYAATHSRAPQAVDEPDRI